MIAKFDADNLKQLRADMNEAVRAVAEKHGIVIDVGNIKYTHETCDIKISAHVKSEQFASDVDPKWVRNFNVYAMSYGFKPSDIGAKFILNDKLIEIVGMRQRAEKNLIFRDLGDNSLKVIEATRARSMFKPFTA